MAMKDFVCPLPDKCAEPFIVEGVSLSFYSTNAQAVSIADVWKRGFDHAPPVLKTGRSQWALERKPGPLREELLKYVPAVVKDFGPFVDKSIVDAYTETACTVSVFGYAADMQSSNTEVHSLPTIRLQESGERDIVILNIGDFCRFLRDELKHQIVSPAFIKKEINELTDAKIQQLRACNVKLMHARIKPGDLLFQPAGTWLVEQALGSRNFGLRTAALVKALMACLFISLGVRAI
jgi:hypothetical protein